MGPAILFKVAGGGGGKQRKCSIVEKMDHKILSWDYYKTVKSWLEGILLRNCVGVQVETDGQLVHSTRPTCTVTIVKVGQNIFGGYANESWEGEINQTTFSIKFVSFFSIGAVSKISAVVSKEF